MNGHRLVCNVLQEWEEIVNRVAKSKVGEKVIVCGRSARWWNGECKERIALKRYVHVVIRLLVVRMIYGMSTVNCVGKRSFRSGMKK